MSTLGANRAIYSSKPDAADEGEWAWCSRKRRAIIETLKTLPSPKRLADIGCRSGREALLYGREVAASEVHGFEIDDAALKVARDAGVVGHVWISGETRCPVEDDFFDVIVAGDVIEHLFDPDEFVNELFRVLRPGGRLIVTTPNLAWWWSRLRLLLGRLPLGIGGVSFRASYDGAADLKHLRVSIRNEWTHLLKRHGLRVNAVHGFNYPKHLRFPTRLLDDIFVRRPTLAHSLLIDAEKPA